MTTEDRYVSPSWKRERERQRVGGDSEVAELVPDKKNEGNGFYNSNNNNKVAFR